MRFEQFRIKNFKGIQDVVLHIGDHPNQQVSALVGLNESGKTTVLEAIDFFRNDVPDSERTSLIPRSRQFSFSDTISVRATILLTEDDFTKLKDYAKSIGLKDLQPIQRVEYEKGYLFERSTFASSYEEVFATFTGIRPHRSADDDVIELGSTDREFDRLRQFIKRNLPKVQYFENFLFDFPKRINMEKPPYEAREQRKYRAVMQELLSACDPTQELAIHEMIVNRIRSGSTSEINAAKGVLRRMQTKLSGDLRDAWSAIFRSDPKRLQIDYNIEGSGESERVVLELKVAKDLESFDIAEQSLGFRWFFSFLLFTMYHKSSNRVHSETLFLFDEPASNLHSTAQSKLLQLFDTLGRDNKIVYTTHSHYLINPDWLETTHIVVNEGADYNNLNSSFESTTNVKVERYRQFIHLAETDPALQTHFQPVLDALDYSPSRLDLVPEIVVVEGKNDFYSLRLMERKVREVNPSLSAVHWYPGKGAGGNEAIIRLYIAWGTKFIVLLDADPTGKREKQRYLDEIGPVLEGRIFTLDEINPIFDRMAMEGLFAETDRLAVIHEVYPPTQGYTKAAFNYGIQNQLGSSARNIGMSAETLRNFQEVFAFLLAKMAAQVA